MRFTSVVFVALCLLGTACSQDGAGSAGRRPDARSTIASSPDEVPSDGHPPVTSEPSPTFEPAKVLIDTDEGSVIVDAEKAETAEQRQVGLMFRHALGPDEGMVFLFFEETSGGFWMKNVTIPLSIAFFDVDGTILAILDMDPCKDDPCPAYEPLDEDGRPATYVGALEVNQGKFEQWGVEVGDRITVTH